MGTYNICLYKEVDKKYTNLKTTKLLDSALIGVCAVIRSNMAITSVTALSRAVEVSDCHCIFSDLLNQ